MDKYNNAKIYKIIDNNYTKCYIGSTCESLSQRMARHRQHYKYYLTTNPKKSMTSFYLFDEMGIDNCKIELIENFPCNNKEELLKREGYHIQNNECVNRCVAGRTAKEYKEYYNPMNTEKIKEGLHKWYEKNKEKVKQYNETYRENNKDKIQARSKEVVECSCGAVITKYKLNRHIQSKKHQEYLNNL